MSQVEHHQTGVVYWRSLNQLAETPEVRALIEQEFPNYDPSTIATTSRRKLLKIMGAAMALSGLTLTGCRRWPKEKLAPYTTSSMNHVPGHSEQYATAMEVGGVATPLLVTGFDGRPIKIEGNPSHPMSWIVKGKYGSATSFAQASLLTMYDPDRSKAVVDHSRGDAKASTWEAFGEAATVAFGQAKAKGGIAVLSEPMSGPSAMEMRKRFSAAYPQAKWYEYEPLSRDNELEGSRLAFGKAVRTRLNLEKAKVIVSLDEDLLFAHPAHTRYGADWADARRGVDNRDNPQMNRVYVAESTFSVTGTVADERLPIEPGKIFALAQAIAAAAGFGAAGTAAGLSGPEAAWAQRAGEDLKKAGNAGVMVAGPSVAPVVHALAHAVNQQIGAVGNTVTLLADPAGDRKTHLADIAALTKAINDKQVSVLLIIGGNPVYDAPADLDFEKALAGVDTSIHLSLYNDETSRVCKWHLPRAHYLEAWGDARAWDGTANLCQPLIEPLFGGKSALEVLAMLSGEKVAAGEAIVRSTWQAQLIKGGDFDKQFRTILEAGILEGSAYPAATGGVTATAFAAPAAMATGGLSVRFTPDSHVYDGRYANNGWLQETHDPITKLVWDNAAIISKKDADSLGIGMGDVVRIDANGRSMEIAAFIQPGQPVGVITLPLGYGRTGAGNVGSKLGFNTYHLRTTGGAFAAKADKVAKIGKSYVLATTMEHHILEDFAKSAIDHRIGSKGQSGMLVREASLTEFKKDRRSPHQTEEGGYKLQLFNNPSQYNNPNAWGMAVDLNTCIGCNACVVACQAENNIPVVGKEQVMYHREMGWLRIDRYFKSDPKLEHAYDDTNPQVVHQPMMCVHCENAPCEQVCPVAATVHDTEGLNTMVYNRCIGTRYCSNNCPYKVRRFNYFDWQAKSPRVGWPDPYHGFPDAQQNEEVDAIRRLVFNPEVTVRMRGVMEKCTYCTQRLQHVKIDQRNKAFQEHGTQKNDTYIPDGSVYTACQQACPTKAITFGNLNDPRGEVLRLHKNPRAYDVLGELNTKPRTKYLAKLRNPSEDKA